MSVLGAAPMPASWQLTTLGDIRVDLSTSLDPRKTPNTQYELYSIPSFPTGRPEIVLGADVGSTKKTLEPGAVIVSKINPRINRVWVVGNHTDSTKIGSSEWIPFFPVSGILSPFLAYYLRRDHFRNFLASRVSGVGGSLMRVRPETLTPYPFPVIPLPEQHRIVEAIESYLTRLDDVVATLERVQQNLKRYRASVLKAAVEGRLVPTEAELARREGRDYEPASVLLERILVERRRRWIEDAAEKGRAKAEEKAKKAGTSWTKKNNTETLERERAKAVKKYKEPAAPDTADLPELPEGWCWVQLDQLLFLIEGGNATTAQDEPTERRVLRSSAVRQGRIDFDDSRYLAMTAARKATACLEEGDLLFTRLSGSLEYVGNCAQVPPLAGKMIEFPDRIFRGRVVPDLSGRFIEHCFAVRALRTQLEEAAKSAAGHQRIGLDDLRKYRIPLPPKAEQQRISNDVEKSLSVIDTVEREVGLQRKRSSRLRQSILKWAFEGKLVDQDPDDEPASILLERIRTERAKMEDAKKGASKRGRRRRAS